MTVRYSGGVAMVSEVLSLTLGKVERAPAYPALSSRHAVSSNIVWIGMALTRLGATATAPILLKPKHTPQHQHASLTECGGSGDPAKEG